MSGPRVDAVAEANRVAREWEDRLDRELDAAWARFYAACSMELLTERLVREGLA